MAAKWSTVIVSLWATGWLIASLLLVGCAFSPEEEGQPRGPWLLRNYNIKPVWNERDLQVPLVLASLPDELPNRFQLSDIPKVGDQRPQASGTAWAAGYLAASYVQIKKNNYKNYLCSPAYLYNNLNQGIDRGIEIVDSVKFLKDQGCADIKIFPYRPEDPAYRPGIRARENARKYRVSGYGRVDFTDLDQVQAHLLQELPIVVTMRISDNFIELEDRMWERPVGNFAGRHSMAVIGYDDTKENFLLQNSIGEDWGDEGKVSISYSWFLRLATQAYIIW